MKQDLPTAEVPKEIVKHHKIVMPEEQWVLIVWIRLMHAFILTYFGMNRNQFYYCKSDLGVIENAFYQK